MQQQAEARCSAVTVAALGSGCDGSVVKSQLGSLGGVEDSRQQRESSRVKVLTSSVAIMLMRV